MTFRRHGALSGVSCRRCELDFFGDYRRYFNANETFRSTLRGIITCLRRDVEGALLSTLGSAGGVPPVVHFQFGLKLISIGSTSFVFVALK